MYIKEKQEDRIMQYHHQGSKIRIESVTFDEFRRAVFIYDHLGKLEGRLVIGIYDYDKTSFIELRSTHKLKLQEHALDKKIDIYEFEDL